jgi:hypothetical protein
MAPLMGRFAIVSVSLEVDGAPAKIEAPDPNNIVSLLLGALAGSGFGAAGKLSEGASL